LNKRYVGLIKKEGVLETESVSQKAAKPQRSKKPDYIAAIVVNTIILVIVNQILNWGILPFLTQDFNEVLPIQNILLAITIVFNAIFLLYNPQWFESLLKIVLNAVGIAVLMRFLNVFPFDFSAYSGFNWALLARWILIIGIVGCGIAILVEAFKFIAAVMRGK
jgi:hypothetical protein